MKFLIIGDLHGSKPNIYYKAFDAIIAPGDFCSSEARVYMFQALKERLKNPKSKLNWYDMAGQEKAKDIVKRSVQDGRKILEFLNSNNTLVYVVPGNNDWTKDNSEKWDFLKKDYYSKLIQGLDNIIDVHYKIKNIGEFNLIGSGISSGPEYPQYKEDKFSLKPKELITLKKRYKLNYKKLSNLFEQANKPIIYLSHNVPFNTTLDKIVNPESPRNGQHFGSLIARQIIEKYQPLVCIGGHMHEHFGKCKIGKTVCINTGFGPKINIFLELEGNKIKKLEFYKGK